MNMTKIAQSKAATSAAAVADLREQLGNSDFSLVVFFHSIALGAASVAADMQAAFPNAVTLGCTTAGELISGEMPKGAIVAMGFERAMVPSVAVAVAENLESTGASIREAVKALTLQVGSLMTLDGATNIGLVLTDGMAGAEEGVLARLGELSEVRFIGGSAGDDLAFKETFVSVNGQTYNKASVLAVLNVPNGYQVIKTQSFCQTLKKLTPTKVNEATREVLEFDGQPAAEAYRKAVGAETLEEAAGHFMDHPVGLMDGNEPYVRSPQTFVGDSLRFYCAVNEGVELTLLQGTDIVKDTIVAVQAAAAAKPIAGIINFHCILRTLGLMAAGKTQDYADVFKDIPTIGFSTYGEADIGHINQTSTMIAFNG